MKRACLILMVLILFSACVKESTSYPPLTLNEITGDRLWQRISAEEEYDDYPEWPGLDGMRRGQSPHGRYHEIYIHPVLRNSLPLKSRTVPDGSVIVKENFDADQVKTNYTVMAKIKGFDPEHGDWFWAMYDATGKTAASGRLNMCIACHEGKKDNDYVIVRPLDRPLEDQ